MNSSKKNKCFDAIPRVRKRNSTSYKAASHHGVQGRASLLKNNKTLAVTLQETRCQLSDYKTFFEESLECISKVKIAKSKMVQLSTALKDFVKSFDETLLSMEFDDLKWTNFKASTQSSKSFENEMNPVLEVADESFDQKMSCEEENDQNYECSTDQPMQVSPKSVHGGKEDPKILVESPHKEEGKLDSQIEKTKENVDMKKKVANLSSHTVKGTKIPRCKVLPVYLKSRKDSKQKNKISMRKSLEKKSEESVPNFSRRKTFVVKKNSNVLVDSEPKDNVLVGTTTVENEDVVNSDEITNVPHDALIVKNAKRKTLVKKSSEVLKNPTFATPLINSLEDKESEMDIDKASAVQDDDLIVKNNKRKTFVKASSLKTVCDHTNEVPDKECTPVDSECAPLESGNHENEHHGKDFKLSSGLQPYVYLSEMDDALCNNKPNSLVEIEPAEAVTSLNVDATASAREINDEMPPANEPLSSEDKTKEDNTASEISPSKEIKEINQTAIVDEASSSENKMEQDVMNKAVIFSGNCIELSDSDCEKKSADVRQSKQHKNYKMYFETSDSDCEEIPPLESFHERKKTLEVTPVRKLITNKKKKFVFDAKKRKSALKRESICKVRKSEIDSKYPEKNTKVGVPKVVCNDDETDVNNCAVEDKNAAHFDALDDLVNKGHSDNIESDTDKVSKKHSKTKKVKYVRDASVESAHHGKKKDDKGHKIKKSKKNLLKNKPIENSSPSKLKTKKKNTKKPSDHDDSILKFSEEDNLTRDTGFQYNEINRIDYKEPPEADFPCKKTGENTFLVHAEIHPPPPSSDTPNSVKEELNKENHMLNLQNMQVAVVLEDVFKSTNIGFLNLCDKVSLCRRTASLKIPLSAATNNIAIDPNESIEKMRSDEGANHSDLQSEALLDVGTCDLYGDAVLGTEKPRSRRRKEVNYKEPPRNTKMRRC